MLKIFDNFSFTVTTNINPNFSTFHQPSPILDFAWFPGATSTDPASFCFVASVRECPVKLLDASDGRVRYVCFIAIFLFFFQNAYFSPYFSYGRLIRSLTTENARLPLILLPSILMEISQSLAFPPFPPLSYSQIRLYCGFEDAIEVFDVHSPGEGERLATTPSKKSKDGLKGKFFLRIFRIPHPSHTGIISALAFSPSQDIYAAGSLAPSNSNIALFSESENTRPVMFVAADIKAGVTQVCMCSSWVASELRRMLNFAIVITLFSPRSHQLHFNPTKPHIMYASFRRQDAIYSWDLRGEVSTPLQVFRRKGLESVARERETGDGEQCGSTEAVREMTNQKMRFDVDFGGKWLSAGNQVSPQQVT